MTRWRFLMVVGCAAVVGVSCGATGSKEQGARSQEAGTQQGSEEPGARSEEAATVPAAPEAPPAPPAPPAPVWEEVAVPAGTTLSVRLETPLASDTSAVEDPVRGTLLKPVVVGGRTLIEAGASVRGHVTAAAKSGKVKGRARLAFRFDQVQAGDELLTVRTSTVAREAASTKGKDAAKIGIGAGLGTAIGAIAGGGKGAAIGAGIGAAGGTGAVMATKGAEVRLDAGTPVSVDVLAPFSVRVRVG